MKKYCYVQLKRMLRIFLPVLMVAVILFGCLMAVWDALSNPEGDVIKTRIGIVGTAGDLYLQLGLKAMESVDSSREAIELVEMQEQEAEQAMYAGSIDAFIVIPENFMESAMYGEILPMKFVSTAGSPNIVSMVKEEFSKMIEIMLLEAQKGIYGAGDAMVSQGFDDSGILGKISVEYVDLVFKRSNMYEAGISASFRGIGLEGYLLSGIGVTLFLLTCLTFSPVMVREDLSLMRVLRAKGRWISGLTLCDFAFYFLSLCGVAGVLAIYLVLWMQVPLSISVILQILPVVFALGAMSFLMYELTNSLITGVLLQFFAILVLCFISGCLYPITFFPERVQALAQWLPTGMARIQVANCMTESPDWKNTGALLGCGCVFLLIAVFIRKGKTAGARG